MESPKVVIGRLKVVIELDEDVYQAYCPDLPGCQTWGHTKTEALRYIEEAVELYVYDLIADGKIRLVLM